MLVRIFSPVVRGWICNLFLSPSCSFKASSYNLSTLYRRQFLKITAATTMFDIYLSSTVHEHLSSSFVDFHARASVSSYEHEFDTRPKPPATCMRSSSFCTMPESCTRHLPTHKNPYSIAEPLGKYSWWQKQCFILKRLSRSSSVGKESNYWHQPPSSSPRLLPAHPLVLCAPGLISVPLGR